jgi:LysM repeat protein
VGALALAVAEGLSAPRCNATNYAEFFCHSVTAAASFEATAAELHVNPSKLWELNFQYDRKEGVKPGDSLRVPYDRCQTKPGVWECHDVVSGDTLESVAMSPRSVMLNYDTLKYANLDVLHGEDTLYAGQQLRLPRHTCYDTKDNECYTVADGDTLASIVATYYYPGDTTQSLCANNGAVFGTIPWTSITDDELHVGMELSVPRLHPNPPSPCQKIPGYWTCYTVSKGDSLYTIGPKLHIDYYTLETLNFADNTGHVAHCEVQFDPATGSYVSQCGNATACPPVLHGYPECLAIGSTIVSPDVTCTPKAGAYECIETDGAEDSNLGYQLHSLGSPVEEAFFAKANWRWPDVGGALPHMILKARLNPCIPTDISYCSDHTYPSGAGVWDADGKLSTGQGSRLATWDGNELAFHSHIWGVTGPYRIPRGSVIPGLQPQPIGVYPLNTQSTECTPQPGRVLCHKPVYGPGSAGYSGWTDTVDDIAAEFGIDPELLCAVNQLKNCSAWYWEGSALVIPIPGAPAPTPNSSAV